MHIVVTPFTRQFDVAYRVLAVRIAPGCTPSREITAIGPALAGEKEYLVTWHELHFAVMCGYSVTLIPEKEPHW